MPENINLVYDILTLLFLISALGSGAYVFIKLISSFNEYEIYKIEVASEIRSGFAAEKEALENLKIEVVMAKQEIKNLSKQINKLLDEK